jgi:pimeloyl-ACP methyl ester carboxylesterase
LFESMMKYDGRPVLERIEVPTIIIGGKQDSVTPQKHQEEMHQLVKGSDFFMVPYGSHCTQLDMPELVNLKIERFLRAVGVKLT